MMQQADTIGVFQIESRAQMATLPRMKPECFYDVVVEVAIIRPGPIQGDLVHPYLARRAGQGAGHVFRRAAAARAGAHPRRAALPGAAPAHRHGHGRFQRQRSGGTAARAQLSPLRRAHGQSHRAAAASAWRRKACPSRVIDRIVQACGSFALYGFPESHAISFAILAYASAWYKLHRAPEFFCSLLNCQPMGFYAPATLVQDAKRHGLRVRPVCVVHSRVALHHRGR